MTEDKDMKHEEMEEKSPEAVEEAINDQSSGDEDETNEITEEEKLMEQIEEQKDKILRLSAEFKNYKKRIQKEKKDLAKYANNELLKDLLPVIDNFERALQSAENDDDKSTIVEGMEMIKKSLDTFLENHNVESFNSVGEKFDPNFHHAVMMEESDDYESDVVVDELQKGYTIGDKVLRHAMVKVAKNNNENNDN